MIPKDIVGDGCGPGVDMTFRLFHRFLFTVAFYVGVNLTAQVEVLPIQKFTTADGLSHGTVWGIAQDAQGFIWFATPGGLNRFDGYKFHNYYQSPLGLSDSQVRDVLAVGDTLWLATGMGVNVFNPTANTFAKYKHAADDLASLSSDYTNVISSGI